MKWSIQKLGGKLAQVAVKISPPKIVMMGIWISGLKERNQPALCQLSVKNAERPQTGGRLKIIRTSVKRYFAKHAKIIL